jgi:hypothetical protein
MVAGQTLLHHAAYCMPHTEQQQLPCRMGLLSSNMRHGIQLPGAGRHEPEVCKHAGLRCPAQSECKTLSVTVSQCRTCAGGSNHDASCPMCCRGRRFTPSARDPAASNAGSICQGLSIRFFTLHMLSYCRTPPLRQRRHSYDTAEPPCTCCFIQSRTSAKHCSLSP